MLNELVEAGYSGLVVQITGEPGKGKTLMALQANDCDYGSIALINADAKRAFVTQVLNSGAEFGFYADAVAETQGMKEIKRHEWYLRQFDAVEALPPERRRVIIIDAWEKFEVTLKPYVESNPKKFQDFWSSMGTFKGAQEWQASHDYSTAIMSRLSGLCDMLILTSHLRNAYKAGVRIPGKYKPDNKVPLVQKTNLRVWLRENPSSPVPIALLMKRNLVKLVGGKPVNVLPRKLVPNGKDESVWDAIRRYWNEPVGNRALREDEVPDEFEVSILEGTLTEDQQHAWELAVQQAAEAEKFMMQERSVAAKETYDEAGGGMNGYKAVQEEMDISLPEAIELVKGAE